MQVGYARVSTGLQNADLQRHALKAAGCSKIFFDQASGTTTRRIQLDRALKALKPGDTLVVWKLDRLGRSLSHLVGLIAQLAERKINFKSLSDPIDTTTAGGTLVLHIMGALAQFERSLIVERTQAGLAAAKRRGTQLGRKHSLTADQVAHARQLIEGGESRSSVARTLDVGVATIYRALARERLAQDYGRLPAKG
jgi:DNA invertase Pin-like site-specific DNA recombinase